MFARGIGVLLAGCQGLLSLRAQFWDTSLALPGCESIAAEGSYVWVFSYDRRAAIEDTTVRAQLFRFKGNEAVPFLRELTPEGGVWRPFGLMYLDSCIWFLNGTKERPTEVWRYKWNGEKLVSPKVWRHSHFVSLQAICPTARDRFYVANDRHHAARWHLVAGFLIGRVRSTILLCEGDSCRRVADHIPYASGLAYLPQQRRLLVGVAFKKALWVYQEEGVSSPSLRYIRKVRLPAHPDNLTVVSESTVWVLGHRRLGAWARSLTFGGERSRWLIMEVRSLPEDRFVVRTLYRAPRRYATASAAVPIGDYIYVGSIFEPYLLRLKGEETIQSAARPTNTGGDLGSTPP
ncbi:MAG: hypothetical protein RMK19_08225 [Bacteroidia bacterium]|nr:hypothetical protein [Bacteroidia bacterium]MDW8015983.1 hypothetical protein [Bacteroidia bacterium]